MVNLTADEIIIAFLKCKKNGVGLLGGPKYIKRNNSQQELWSVKKKMWNLVTD